MAAKGGMTDDYRASAFRHLHDAQQLAALGRYDNAGHLIGFAGECAMKCKMKSMKLSGPDMIGHHPVPQGVIKRAMQRNRMSGQWLALVSSKKLFDGWSVDQRYSPDSTVTLAKYTEWLKDATTIISLLGFK